MNKQIVVTLDENGALTPLLQTRFFALYQKSKAQWHRTESFELTGQMTDAMTIRKTISVVAQRFQDSRIIISRKVTGIAYQTMDKTGFSIFEADELSDELLDTVLGDVMNTRAEADRPPIQPQSPSGDGHFVFDLVRLQKAYPQMSSKKALMAFVTAADFITLELICDHLPPWLEELMKTRGYRYSRKSETPGTLSYFIEKV